MSSLRLESLSSFGRLAVELDGHFSELTRLSGQIERLDIESESGLALALKLLNQFAEHGKSISEGIKDFSKVLQEAREGSEAAANRVAERAQFIYQRKQSQNEMRNQLNRVEENVKAANASLASSRSNGKSELTNEEKLQVRTKLERLNEDLKRFIADVQLIKEAAGQSKFKSIESEAKNLLDALRSSSRRIDRVMEGDGTN
jgi:uncharacterized phage infection (PIP) family protein YhgE